MASSRPLAILVDDEDDWGSFSPPPTMSLHPTSSRTASSGSSNGEFNAFAVIGAAITVGGGPSEMYGFLMGMRMCAWER
jgi:hypothetical protein